MRRGVGTLVGFAATAALLAGCPSTTVPQQPTGSGQPTAQGTASSGADLYGSVRYEDHTSFTNPPGDPSGNGSDDALFTINVQLKRDPDDETHYIDTGASRFTPNVTSHRDVMIGLDPQCQGVSDWQSEAAEKAFGPPVAPDDPGSSIEAVWFRELNTFSLDVQVSYSHTQNINACMGGQALTQTIHTGGPLLCGLTGLPGAYVDVSGGPDEFDMSCSIGTVVVTGTVSLRQ